jgi:single-strand DNA-binding protein
MSKGFSFAQIGGTLGKDPESRSTSGGTKIVSFSLAVEKGFGEKASTSWFNIISFDKNAEFAEKYLKKGKSVTVCGDLQIRSWDDKNSGQKRYTTEITAYKIDFADSGTRSGGGEQQGRSAPAPQARQEAAAPTRAGYDTARTDSFNGEDDDIPF